MALPDLPEVAAAVSQQLTQDLIQGNRSDPPTVRTLTPALSQGERGNKEGAERLPFRRLLRLLEMVIAH